MKRVSNPPPPAGAKPAPPNAPPITEGKTRAQAKPRNAPPPPPPPPITPPATAEAQTHQIQLDMNNPREREIALREREFSLKLRMAERLAQSTIVPKEYRANPANCMIAYDMAERMGTGVIEVVQNLDIIHGRPSWRAKYKKARLNTSGLLGQRTQFEFENRGQKTLAVTLVEWEDTSGGRSRVNRTYTDTVEDLACRCIGIDRDGNPFEGPWVSVELAFMEGWYTKDGSKWKTMPDMMLRYRATSFLVDSEFPEVVLGLQTTEDLEAMGERDVTPAATRVGSVVHGAAHDRLQERRNRAFAETRPAGTAEETIVDLAAAQEAEQLQPDIAAVHWSAEQIADEIAAAKNGDQVDIARDLIRDLQPDSDISQDELHAACDLRLSELEAVAGQ